jgi:hypothetical protein
MHGLFFYSIASFNSSFIYVKYLVNFNFYLLFSSLFNSPGFNTPSTYNIDKTSGLSYVSNNLDNAYIKSNVLNTFSDVSNS